MLIRWEMCRGSFENLTISTICVLISICKLCLILQVSLPQIWFVVFQFKREFSDKSSRCIRLYYCQTFNFYIARWMLRNAQITHWCDYKFMLHRCSNNVVDCEHIWLWHFMGLTILDKPAAPCREIIPKTISVLGDHIICKCILIYFLKWIQHNKGQSNLWFVVG